MSLPVSTSVDGFGSNAANSETVGLFRFGPIVPLNACESHSIKSSEAASAVCESRFKSGSTRVSIMSEPMMYTDLSDCSTPFLRSNVEESVTVCW